jgi:hypothetical protein
MPTKKIFFFLVLLLIMEGSGSGQIMMDPDPRGPKIFGSGFITLVTGTVG